MNPGTKVYILEAWEVEWLRDNHFNDLADKFNISVQFNGVSYLGCEAATIDLLDADWDYFKVENVVYDTVYYYKSGMFFDRP